MPRSLRIAVWYNLPSGGARRAVFDQVKGLLQRGHRVEVWRPKDDSLKGGFADLGTIVQEHEVPFRKPSQNDRSLITRTRHRLQRREMQIAAMVEHSAACAKEIEAGGFDILFAHNDSIYNAPYIGRAVSGIPKLLSLAEPHRLLYEAAPTFVWSAPLEPQDRVRLDRRLYRDYIEHIEHDARRVQVREEVRNARGFDRVLANSYFSRESILRAYGREGLDVQVCYLGIDLDYFVNGHLPRERFVLGLGTIAPAKNLEGAIRAVGTIARDRPPLVWAGSSVDGPYRENMEALARRLGVDLQLKVAVSDEELRSLLSRAGAMVFAPFLEPFGYSPLEANACGLAVAAVAEGGVRETVVDGVNGILAESDAASLGKAIVTILDDPHMGERAERHVRAIWGLDKSIDRLERHLIEVASPSSD